MRECMKINKIRPKFHFSTKNRNKNDLPCVWVLLFTVSSPLEPFGSRAFYWRLRFWVVLTVKRNGKAGDSEAGRSSSWKWSKLAKIAVKGSVDNLSFPSILLESQISSQPLAKRLILTFFHKSFLSRYAYDRAFGRDVINGRSQLTSQRQSASVRGGGTVHRELHREEHGGRVPGSIWPGRKKLGRWNEWGRAI